MRFNIEKYDSVTSTNDIATVRAASGAAEGTVIIASSQTNGRGRMGRRFVSASESGLYMSILLRPRLSAKDSLLITTAAAVAVAEAIENVSGKLAKIKWVNDVYVDGKKVCGILTEGRISGGSLEYAVLGIGVNLVTPEGGFDGEIKDIAGAAFDGIAFDKDGFVSDLLQRFAAYYVCLADAPHYSAYAERSILDGEEVDVIRGGERVAEGRVIKVNRDFSLQIITDGGEISLSSGEVSVKKKCKLSVL